MEQLDSKLALLLLTIFPASRISLQPLRKLSHHRPSSYLSIRFSFTIWLKSFDSYYAIDTRRAIANTGRVYSTTYYITRSTCFDTIDNCLRSMLHKSRTTFRLKASSTLIFLPFGLCSILEGLRTTSRLYTNSGTTSIIVIVLNPVGVLLYIFGDDC